MPLSLATCAPDSIVRLPYPAFPEIGVSGAFDRLKPTVAPFDTRTTEPGAPVGVPKVLLGLLAGKNPKSVTKLRSPPEAPVTGQAARVTLAGFRSMTSVDARIISGACNAALASLSTVMLEVAATT